MPEFNERDKALHKYIESWDRGDIDGVIEVLELASYDLELERIIQEINLAYQEEEGITAIATDAATVRDLIQQHLHSAFENPDSERANLIRETLPESTTKLITVGDVARRLQQSKSLKKSEYELVQSLINSSIPIPSSPNLKAIKQLFVEDLQQDATPRFIDNFRKVAIKLSMGFSYDNAQLAAARQHKKNSRSTNK